MVFGCSFFLPYLPLLPLFCICILLCEEYNNQMHGNLQVSMFAKLGNLLLGKLI